MYIYQLKATFNVRIRSRGVLKRSTTPYLRSGCTMELDPLPFCCSRLPVDGFDEVPKTCSNSRVKIIFTLEQIATFNSNNELCKL